MRYVLDSNVALKWLFIEANSDKARKLRDDYRNTAVDLLAPDVFPVEFAHAVTRAERAKRITQAEGAQSMTDLLAFLPALHDSLTLLPRAYEISSVARIGVYDCLSAALAEREQCELVTADQRLVSALGSQFPIVSLGTL
jgi:predicted nucleic acid-binding protein